MNNIELLAPAGSIESLYAAVQAGANAVYLGGSKFSARAYASNFDNETMEKAVRYCHLYNVKVYVTINTLLKEKELKEAVEYSRFLYKIGVNGLIIQDTGLAYMLKSELPNFELHASTQMTVHNMEGAKLLKKLGFKRIVLSRELSLKEIKDISKELGIETEIFIHGALCICYSGQCLMSSIIGGRSGNRGRCAQPCRLPYTLLDKTYGKEKKAYILSPKDICTLQDIKDIVSSGAGSLKIEGRMKRPEYVAGVVDTYRKAIDSLESNNFDFKKGNRSLLQLFNREGFSKAYLFGNVGKDMMAYSFPKNTGVFLGKINKDLSIDLEEEISIKDGIRNNEKGFTVSKIMKNNKEVPVAFKGDRVKIYPNNYNFNDSLFKTSDVNLLKEYEEYYINPYKKKNKLDVEIIFKVNSPLKITTSINDKLISVEGDIVQKAIKRPLEKNKIEENLRKTGDTPFEFEKIVFIKYEEGFLPVSSINEVRRNFLLKVEQEILSKWKKEEHIKGKEHIDHILKEEKKSNKTLPKYIVYITTKEQLRAVVDSGIKDIAFNPFMRKNEIMLDDLLLKDLNVYLKISNIIKEEFEVVSNFIENNLQHIKGIITANLGIISRFHKRISIIGDYKLNTFNRYSVEFFKELLDMNCLSVELNKKEIEETSKHSKGYIQNLIYGKIELMVSEYCPIGSCFGGRSSKKNKCNGYCKEKEFSLIDRMGEGFILLTDKFCRSYIYNSVPLNLINNIGELEKSGGNSFRLDFIDENYNKTLEILKATLNKNWGKDFKNFTRGHYKRGVE
ncbi:putative protease [Clostridium tetanomorphum]|uniref:DUF3656 domain-containing U32 family peptidase n=1 Tax=Clostridium tetanomorphum TaxID=1553 RepID=UPI0004489362|nr:U32 family peptidase [Clostridium tetanomorphum]KAJ52289.1 protease [Clostridium tetanomorphum DSM 665]MBP1866326.1 putative protease [Clostridium tetanomorphum]NRS85817.1 putative protease [Clostridium tetanomorphum]SQC02450.1 protease [Clostridium tetanomorphum]